jgi:hypothetical protein
MRQWGPNGPADVMPPLSHGWRKGSRGPKSLSDESHDRGPRIQRPIGYRLIALTRRARTSLGTSLCRASSATWQRVTSFRPRKHTSLGRQSGTYGVNASMRGVVPPKKLASSAESVGASRGPSVVTYVRAAAYAARPATVFPVRKERSGFRCPRPQGKSPRPAHSFPWLRPFSPFLTHRFCRRARN